MPGCLSTTRKTFRRIFISWWKPQKGSLTGERPLKSTTSLSTLRGKSNLTPFNAQRRFVVPKPDSPSDNADVTGSVVNADRSSISLVPNGTTTDTPRDLQAPSAMTRQTVPVTGNTSAALGNREGHEPYVATKQFNPTNINHHPELPPHGAQSSDQVAGPMREDDSFTLSNTPQQRNYLLPDHHVEVPHSKVLHEEKERAPRSRAVLIGIHYKKHANKEEWIELDTPIKDVRKMHRLLQKHGYNEFRILVDEFVCGYKATDVELPTKKTIIDALKWLVGGAKPGDRLFVHYCGHGHQVETQSLGESDFHDEAILPLAVNGKDSFIIDNELHAILVASLPPGCTLMALFDCCHSGTLLDLPWNHSRDGTTERKSPPALDTSDPLPRSTSPQNMSPASERRKSRRPLRRSSTHQSVVKNPLRLPYIVLPDAVAEATTPGPVAPTEMNPLRSFATNISPIQRIDRQKVLLQNATKHLERRRSTIEVMRPSDMKKSESLERRPRSEVFNLPSFNLPRSSSPMSRKTTLDTITENHVSALPQEGTASSGQMFASPVSSLHREPLHEPAQVIAVAACQDRENVFEMTSIGGLLTNTFLEFLETSDYQTASLEDIIEFLWKRFIEQTKEMHKECEPCMGCKDADCGLPLEEGHCVAHWCDIPVEPPVPLITSLGKLSRDDPPLKGLFDATGK